MTDTWFLVSTTQTEGVLSLRWGTQRGNQVGEEAFEFSFGQVEFEGRSRHPGMRPPRLESLSTCADSSIWSRLPHPPEPQFPHLQNGIPHQVTVRTLCGHICKLPKPEPGRLRRKCMSVLHPLRLHKRTHKANQLQPRIYSS